MNIFQRVYNWFKKIVVPAWYKELGDEVQKLLLTSLQNITSEMVLLLKAKIKDLETKNLTGKEKFANLVEYAKQIGIDISKQEANVFLNSLVLSVKGKF